MDYDFLDIEAISRLRALPFESSQTMSGTVTGRHRSPHRGSSVEFAQYRKYVAGDDTRTLDWKAYARSDRFYVKEFEADTNLRAYFVIDASGSMQFSSQGNETKLQMARRMTSMLSYLLIHQGDATGLFGVSEGTHLEVPSSRQPAQLQRICQSLEGLSAQGETRLSEALHQIAEKVRSRGLIIIFSDCLTDLDDLGDALQHLKHRWHEVALFHILDPQELSFDFNRPYRFVNLEGEDSYIVEPRLIQEEYLQALNRFLEQVKKKAYDSGVDYQLVKTTESPEEVLSHFLRQRLGRKRKR